jgi:LysR family glycine cleavage system transcriptional activator
MAMKKRLPPLNWLRAFEASARHLNFTHAAAELNLTQAAISQQVKGLESQLGANLFKRLPRGLELTEAGQAYMPVIHDSIERLAAATDELFGQGRKRPITVRVNLVFFTTWLAPRLGHFRAAHPEIGLQFTSNIWQDKHGGEDDMEIRYGKGNWAGLRTVQLTHDELFPVCSPQLLSGNPTPASPSELKADSMLHVIGYEEGWGHWLNKTGFQDIDASQGMQFDTLITTLEMAARGHGLALGRTSLVTEMLANGRLIAPFEQRILASEAFHLSRPTHMPLSAQGETFWAWLVEESKQASNGE